jgi:hypothetical protein
MTKYSVLIDDNFHYMDESERVHHGVFDTADEAIAACKRIVDECLDAMPAVTADELYEKYVMFGDDPFIVPVDPAGQQVDFSARAYAKERCAIIAAGPPPVD